MNIYEKIVCTARKCELIFKRIVGLPMVGEISNRFLVEPPRLADNRFGRATDMPTILEIYISDEHQWPLHIGSKVKHIYFEKYQPIVFNVCFCCAQPTWFSGGDYANPLSHWFNVFYGFYEIDVPKSKWDRPFGFMSASGYEPCFDDLLRIAKSDWNYFSNNIYGVPNEVCAAYDGTSMDGVSTHILDDCVSINGRRFVECRMDCVKVVSGYVSGTDGAKLVNNDGIFSPIWRMVFGRPRPQPEYPSSFIPTDMRMQCLMSYREEYDEDLEETAWKTTIGGGSVNLGYRGPVDNDAFLAAQMDAVSRSLGSRPFQKRFGNKKSAQWKIKR